MQRFAHPLADLVVRLSVCAFAIHSMYANLSFKTTIIKQNIKIILIVGVPSSPGQALLGFLITEPPSVCVPDVIGALACGFQTNKKSKNLSQHFQSRLALKERSGRALQVVPFCSRGKLGANPKGYAFESFK